MGCGHGRSVDGAWTRIGRQDGRIERPCTCFFPTHARAYDSHVRPPQRRRTSSSSSSSSRRSSSRRRKLLAAPIKSAQNCQWRKLTSLRDKRNRKISRRVPPYLYWSSDLLSVGMGDVDTHVTYQNRKANRASRIISSQLNIYIYIYRTNICNFQRLKYIYLYIYI
jgi:hypothetical protein